MQVQTLHHGYAAWTPDHTDIYYYTLTLPRLLTAVEASGLLVELAELASVGGPRTPADTAFLRCHNNHKHERVR